MQAEGVISKTIAEGGIKCRKISGPLKKKESKSPTIVQEELHCSW